MNEELLRRILGEELKGVKEDIAEMKAEIKELSSKVDRLEERQEAMFEEVGGLMEFRTDVTDKIVKLTETVDFIKHKGAETEQEVFTLKKKLS